MKKNMGGMGLLSEKKEAATSSYSAEVDFLQYIIRCLWLRIIRRSDQGFQFMLLQKGAQNDAHCNCTANKSQLRF